MYVDTHCLERYLKCCANTLTNSNHLPLSFLLPDKINLESQGIPRNSVISFEANKSQLSVSQIE